MSFFNVNNILSLLPHYNTIINSTFLLFSFNVNFLILQLFTEMRYEIVSDVNQIRGLDDFKDDKDEWRETSSHSKDTALSSDAFCTNSENDNDK